MMKHLALVGALLSSSVVASAPSTDVLAKLLQAQPQQLVALYEGKFADVNPTAADIWQSSTAGMSAEQKLMVVKEALSAIASNSSTTVVPAALREAGITNEQVWKAAKLVALTLATCTAVALVVYVGVQYFKMKNSADHQAGRFYNKSGLAELGDNIAHVLNPAVGVLNHAANAGMPVVDALANRLTPMARDVINAGATVIPAVVADINSISAGDLERGVRTLMSQVGPAAQGLASSIRAGAVAGFATAAAPMPAFGAGYE